MVGKFTQAILNLVQKRLVIHHQTEEENLFLSEENYFLSKYQVHIYAKL